MDVFMSHEDCFRLQSQVGLIKDNCLSLEVPLNVQFGNIKAGNKYLTTEG